MLLQLPFDGTGNTYVALFRSAEFLDPSEIGDFMVVEEALTRRELHFEFLEYDGSSMSCDFNSLLVL